MTHKPFIWIVMIFVLTACGSKNPGMSKEDAVKVLDETAQKETEIKAASVAVTEFPDNYTPPPGIKYQPKIITDGVVTLNIQAALKNLRSIQLGEQGKMEVYRPGVECPMEGWSTLIPLKNGYLLNTIKGIYQLDSSFKLNRQLFTNDVEVGYGKYSFFKPKQMIYNTYYDSSNGQLRGAFMQIDKKRKDYVASLSLDDLLTSDAPWTPENLTSKLPVRLGCNYKGIEGGFSQSFSGLYYTFGTKGDTLCCFKLGNPSDYDSGSIARTGERLNSYTYQNKIHFRIPYGNTLYRLEDTSTLKAIYRLDFGTLPRATQKEVSSKDDIDHLYYVNDWSESDRYLFIRLAKGYDCPNSREAGTVSLYSLLYDKESKTFFSVIDTFYPDCTVNGIPVMLPDGKKLKSDFPKSIESPDLSDISDYEQFIVILK